MKSFLIGAMVVCLAAPLVVREASAQDIDARCGELRDKVACTCALQNGGRIIRPAGARKQGWWTRWSKTRQSSRPPDSARIYFPAKFKREGLKLRPSPALAGYLACMNSRGRK
jgi:hypothetical protein